MTNLLAKTFSTNPRLELPNREWLDKKGDVIHVLSVDYENSLVTIEWPNHKKRGTRAVSIQKFLSQVKSIDAKAEPVKEDTAKPGDQFIAIWVDESRRNFGKSPNLQLSNQDWLERGMHAKTVKFNIGAGGLPPEVNWEDHCAAIAMIEDKPARALASILLWGSDTNWDWSRHFDEVAHHLAVNMVKRFKEDGSVAPQSCAHSLPELAHLMARMVLHFELYELWDIYTVKGRLKFCGININDRTYSNQFLSYQKKILNDIMVLIFNINSGICRYKIALNS